MALSIHTILPASHFESQPCLVDDSHGSEGLGSDDFLTSRLHFRVPLRYDRPYGEKTELVAHVVYAETHRTPPESACTVEDWDTHINANPAARDRPFILYLCGGPGADNPPARNPEMNRWLLQKGYQVLYLNYRGCGESSPVTQETMKHMSDDEKAEHIKLFCQDNIVRDLEAVRLCLSGQLRSAGWTGTTLKWTILGQSYGGYISLTYLSLHPEGLQEIFITAGLPPCGHDIDEYFKILYERLVERNKEFYAAYPEDDKLVREILLLIEDICPENIPMSGRGFMTAQKLLTLGRQFGAKAMERGSKPKGFKQVHGLLRSIKSDLVTRRKLSDATRDQFECCLRVDERPLYPILLEQTWCSGGVTNWAAERIGEGLRGFEHLRKDKEGKYLEPSYFLSVDAPVYFTANTYCRFHFDTHDGLLDLKKAAEILATDPWDCPYDYDRLKQNQVPVYALSFVKDMHLDIGVAVGTAAKVGSLHLAIDEENWHQEIRRDPQGTLERVFQIKEAVEAARCVKVNGLPGSRSAGIPERWCIDPP